MKSSKDRDPFRQSHKYHPKKDNYYMGLTKIPPPSWSYYKINSGIEYCWDCFDEIKQIKKRSLLF